MSCWGGQEVDDLALGLVAPTAARLTQVPATWRFSPFPGCCCREPIVGRTNGVLYPISPRRESGGAGAGAGESSADAPPTGRYTPAALRLAERRHRFQFEESDRCSGRLVILALILLAGGLQSKSAVAQLERSDWVLAGDVGTGFTESDGSVKDDSSVLLAESSLPCYEDPDLIACGHRVVPQQCHETYWYGGVELPMLQPSVSSTSFNISEENSYASPRIYFGREGASGAGFRARFWGMGIEEDTVSEWHSHFSNH